MKALVTGVAGFSGLHLARHLLEQGVELVGVARESGDSHELSQLASHLRIEAADVCDAERMRNLVAEVAPDWVFHLAGKTTSRFTTSNPRSTFDANIYGTMSVLEAVRLEQPSATVLVSGSSGEFGLVRPGENPIREGNPLRPVSPYAVSKVAQGMVAYQYHLSHGLRTIRTRTFNCIGPGQRADLVCSAFAKQIAEIEAGKRSQVIEVGNLESSRDFIDVRDMVEAYALLAQNPKPGGLYNVCSGRPVAIREVLEVLLDLSSIEVEVRQDPTRMQPSDVPVQVGDYSLIQADTGWEPRTRIEASLGDILEDWRQRVAAGE